MKANLLSSQIFRVRSLTNDLVSLGLVGIGTAVGLKASRLLVVVADAVAVDVVASPLATLAVVVLRCSQSGGLECDLEADAVGVLVHTLDSNVTDQHWLAEINLLEGCRVRVRVGVRASHPCVWASTAFWAKGRSTEIAYGAVVETKRGGRVASHVPNTNTLTRGTHRDVLESQTTETAVETCSGHRLTALLENAHEPVRVLSSRTISIDGTRYDRGVRGWTFGIVIGADGCSVLVDPEVTTVGIDGFAVDLRHALVEGVHGPGRCCHSCERRGQQASQSKCLHDF
jgi:hypothetical protein